jgi:hypothetical protein
MSRTSTRSSPSTQGTREQSSQPSSVHGASVQARAHRKTATASGIDVDASGSTPYALRVTEGEEVLVAEFAARAVALNIRSGRYFALAGAMVEAAHGVVSGVALGELERETASRNDAPRYVAREWLRSLRRELLAEHSTSGASAVPGLRVAGRVRSHHLAEGLVSVAASVHLIDPSRSRPSKPDEADASESVPSNVNASRGSGLVVLMDQEIAALVRPAFVRLGGEAPWEGTAKTWFVHGFSESGLGLKSEHITGDQALLLFLDCIRSTHTPEAWRREFNQRAQYVAAVSSSRTTLPREGAVRALMELC